MGTGSVAKPKSKRLEERMLIKAIKDFNCARLNERDHSIVECVLKDIFKEMKTTADTPQSDASYTALTSCLQDSFSNLQLDKSATMQ